MNKFGRPWVVRYNRVSLHIERINGKIEKEKKQERGKEKKERKRLKERNSLCFVYLLISVVKAVLAWLIIMSFFSTPELQILKGNL